MARADNDDKNKKELAKVAKSYDDARAWKILGAYFDDDPYFATRHHLASYDDFIVNGIGRAVKTMNDRLTLDKTADGFGVKVRIGGPDGTRLYIKLPAIKPCQARSDGLTYAFEVFADVTVQYSDRDKEVHATTFERVRICRMPIMLHTVVCQLRDLSANDLVAAGESAFDKGGYFIIDGLEKVIIPQERTAHNRLFVTSSSAPTDAWSHKATIRCVEDRKALFPKTAEFILWKEPKARARCIHVKIHKVAEPVPLFAVFRALGVESDARIVELVTAGLEGRMVMEVTELLRPSIVECQRMGLMTRTACVERLASLTDLKTTDKLKDVLLNDFLPNCDDDFAVKAAYLGLLVRNMSSVALGVAPESDRDHYDNKRLALSGVLVSELFRDLYAHFVLTTKATLDRMYTYGSIRTTQDLVKLVSPANVSAVFDSRKFDEEIMSSFKGAWNKEEMLQEGIIQDMSRLTYQVYLSHIRRIDINFNRSHKLVNPHMLLGSQYGIVCPLETPDGADLGLVKHLALMCHVTSGSDPSGLVKHLATAGWIRLVRDAVLPTGGRMARAPGALDVFVNDTYVGTSADAVALADYLRALRRLGALHPTTSVALMLNRGTADRLSISTAPGRYARPLLIVSNGKLPEISESPPARATFAQRLGPKDATTKNNLQVLLASWKDGALDTEVLAKLHAGGSSRETIAKRAADVGATIEYCDVEEVGTRLVAMRHSDIAAQPMQRWTHLEIHPITMLSLLASTIPLLDHNHAPYCCFGVSQIKQALGLYATNYRDRMDSHVFVLQAPQLPLVTTNVAERLCDGRLVHGENLIVAIMTYTGYNMDDGVLMNRTALERGCFNVTSLHTVRYEEEAGMDGTTRIVIRHPVAQQADDTSVRVEGIRADRSAYQHLDPATGLPLPGSLMRQGQALCGMMLISSTSRTSGVRPGDDQDATGDDVIYRKSSATAAAATAASYSDRTVFADRDSAGYVVDRVHTYTRTRKTLRNMNYNNNNQSNESLQVAKVRLRQTRQPELGDKVASRYGQKGVVGMVLPEEDMPFSQNGLVPDVIINTNALPKRMTVGHVLECLLAKSGVARGERVCANEFERLDLDAHAAALEAHGLHPSGNEIMYCGFDGRQMACEIFIGPNYYGRLKHMVADKTNFRSSGGAVNFLTRQPVHGRGQHGGLRVGEMEQNALVAHGAAHFLKESFMDRSDAYTHHVDADTGISASVVVGSDQGSASSAGALKADADPVDAVATLRVPYALKLVTQELALAGLDMRLMTSSVGPEGESEVESEGNWSGDGHGNDGDEYEEEEEEEEEEEA